MPRPCPLTALHSLQFPKQIPSAAGNTVALRSYSAILRCPPTPLILLIFVTFSVTFIYFSAAPILFNESTANQWNGTALVVIPTADPLDAVQLDNEDVRLARVLKEATMEDKTVILTTLNAAWASTDSIIDLFLESFQIGNGTRWLLDHLVIIAFDKKAYLQCTVMHSHCFALTTMGIDFSGEKNFMSDGYLKMMWRRIDFLRIVLEMGYNFIFTCSESSTTGQRSRLDIQIGPQLSWFSGHLWLLTRALLWTSYPTLVWTKPTRSTRRSRVEG